jgi:tRNA A-37 threonylcarbamoyl transferase component Bud32
MNSEHPHPVPDLQHVLPEIPQEQRFWRLYVFPAWQGMFQSLADVRALLAHPEQVIQQNSRGEVFLVRYQDMRFVAKRSLLQENRRWTQFTSLYRSGESGRMMRNMAKLYELGLPVPEPVLALEKRRFGVVVVSWSVYRYLEGTPCTCAQAGPIARMLKTLHQHGWVHRDPHVKNFLLHDGEIQILDCARARPWKSTYAQMYDLVLLEKCCSGSQSLAGYGIGERAWMYRLAKLQNLQIQRWRRVKRQARAFWRK